MKQFMAGLAIGIVLAASASSAYEVLFPNRLKVRVQAIVDELGGVLFGSVPARVEISNWPAGNSGNSPILSEIRLVSFQDGLVTVPPNTAFEIIGINAGEGVIPDAPVQQKHCGNLCSGGSCSTFSSCSYRGVLWELNGTPIGPLQGGCYVCNGTECSQDIANCPPTGDVEVAEGGAAAVLEVPYWLPAGATFQVNATNTYVSIRVYELPPS